MKNQVKQISKTQMSIDRVIDKVFLRFIPSTVSPNQVTLIRFILIPAIVWLLVDGRYLAAIIMFAIAASTDFIDGAMARTRNQITDIGKVIDPIADKLLIASVLLFSGAGYKYLIVKILLIFISFEIFAVIMGVLFSFAVGKPIGANVFGKIKLILQSFGVGFFMIGILINNVLLVQVAEIILFIALAFAIIAGIESGRRKIIQLKANKVLYPKT